MSIASGPTLLKFRILLWNVLYLQISDPGQSDQIKKVVTPWSVYNMVQQQSKCVFKPISLVSSGC